MENSFFVASGAVDVSFEKVSEIQRVVTVYVSRLLVKLSAAVSTEQKISLLYNHEEEENYQGMVVEEKTVAVGAEGTVFDFQTAFPLSRASLQVLALNPDNLAFSIVFIANY